jgi:hypothetical protein
MTCGVLQPYKADDKGEHAPEMCTHVSIHARFEVNISCSPAVASVCCTSVSFRFAWLQTLANHDRSREDVYYESISLIWRQLAHPELVPQHAQRLFLKVMHSGVKTSSAWRDLSSTKALTQACADLAAPHMPFVERMSTESNELTCSKRRARYVWRPNSKIDTSKGITKIRKACKCTVCRK